MLRRYFILILIALVDVLSLPTTVQAQSQPFRTNLTTTYTITQQTTLVSHRVVITNTLPTQYLAKYGLKVSSPNIRQVSVSSNGQPLDPEVVTTGSQTSIGITFSDQIVGEGKERILEISYQHPDAAIASGQVLEVSVPKVEGAEQYDQYIVRLITPAEYGLPTRITPAKYESMTTNGSMVTTIPITNGAGVTALFGQEQWFQMQIEYDLRNPSQNTSLAQITLPPDTNRQTMYYQSLEPRPVTMSTDPDGNWIATYQLPAQTNLAITANAVAAIGLESRRLPTQTPPTDDLIQAQTFWESNDPTIQTTVDELTNIRSIYDFVVKTLEYDYSQQALETPRLGALTALLKPTLAACEEFTDLFVALARAKEIPARRITGYAYTRNQTLRPLASTQGDILHAWPEYYDQAAQEWVPVDPTWEKTTGGVNYFDLFDLNHIVLAIQGHSSTLPYPAGASFNDGAERKMIEVDFADQLPEITPSWRMAIQPQRIAGLPLPGRYQLELTNDTGRAWYTVSLASGDEGDIQISEIKTQSVVLPYQTVTLPFEVRSSTLIPHASNVSFVISHDQQTQPVKFDHTITAVSPYTELFGVGLAVGGIILFFAIGSRGVLVRRRRR